MMMQKCVFGLSLALLLTTSAQANILNRDCTIEKAARNAAMEATVGVSGNCTAEKAVREQAAKAVGWDEKKDAVNNTQERIKDSKQALNHDIRTAKDRVNNTRDSIDDAIQHPEKAIIKQALK
ncbi:hypothetical protein [Plesiomonas shigelloides]|uniref:hypothetical protein n=1 Tax=Plesiomonas shigelloides TaxID=703 RepID=UPI001C5AF618|nr:hypothetical protein [Plesiomonas shigelloides]MBW3794047.1 hypothetical protein [Plesiomonas shigelloides]